ERGCGPGNLVGTRLATYHVKTETRFSRTARRRSGRWPSHRWSMSIDKSLRRKDSLVRARNVLTRGERILQLQDEERWHEGPSPFGLPKVKVVKVKKAKKGKEEAAAPAEGAAAAGAAAPAAAAPGAK